MRFDPLQNPEAEVSFQQTAEDYRHDPVRFVRVTDSEVQALAGAVATATERADAVRAEVRRGAFICNDAALAAIHAMPVSRTFFRERVNSMQYAELLHAIAKMEEGHGVIRQGLLDYARVGETLRTCYVSAFAARHRVCAVQHAATDASDEKAFSGFAKRLHDVCAACEALETELHAQQASVSTLCFDTLGRFLDAMRVRADLDGDGAACDGGAVRALCAELQQALKPFL